MERAKQDCQQNTKRLPEQQRQKKIDWEQRRYEIAKEVFVGMCVSGHFTQNLANESVQVADDLISVLKNR